MKKMRRGFGLIAAIFFIVLVATTAITALSIATMTARDVNNIHNREQAVLLAQSATEYAILAMQKHLYPTSNKDAAHRCLNSISIDYPNADAPLFNIEVKIDYLDSNMPAGCNVVGTTNLRNAVDAKGANTGNVTSHQALVDVTVTSTADLGGPQIRYHRRTLQKP